MPSAHGQLTKRNPDPHDQNLGNTITDTNPAVLNDLDVPITFHKGVISCTTHPIVDFVSYERLSPQFRAFTTNLSKVDIPRDIHEALQHPNEKVVVHEEIKALEKNGTWELTKLPLGKSIVGCQWIFNVKHKANGNIDIQKAKLRAKGFTQTYGVDYQENFAPIAKLNTIRVLLSIAVDNDWPLHQLEVKKCIPKW